MELLSVNCNGCGAPLEVGADTRFATCNHCGARLAIQRTDSAAFTEFLESIDRSTDSVAKLLRDIKRQNEIERIDREWELERKQYDIQGRTPDAVLGNSIGLMIVAVIMGVFGAFWTVSASQMGAGGFSLFGLVFVGFAVWLGYQSMTGGSKYLEAKERYLERRTAALDQLHESDDADD